MIKRERDLQSWIKELEKVAQEEERRLEAFEKKRMDREDGQSRSRQAWDRIFQSVPKPFPMAEVTGKTDTNSTDDKGKKVKGSWENENNVEASCWKKQKGVWRRKCTHPLVCMYTHQEVSQVCTRVSLSLCQSAELVSRCTGYKPNNVCITMGGVVCHVHRVSQDTVWTHQVHPVFLYA